MKKKILKIAALVIAIALIIGVCWFANGLVGNPISKSLVTRTAEKYIEENFPDTDFELERVTFNFKDTKYHAYIVSPSSVDSSFSLTINMGGKIVLDLYENNVLTGWNTARRLGDAYRESVDQVLESPSFPYDCHIGFGDLEFIPEEYKNEPDIPSYALITNELELDGIYDINELGAKAGKLTIYIYDDTVTIERLAEIILDIKGMLDDAGIGFYVMDCVLEYPKPESGEWKQGRVEVMDFLCSDIYEEGLVERVQASNDAAGDYYDEMDAVKKEEELGK